MLRPRRLQISRWLFPWLVLAGLGAGALITLVLPSAAAAQVLMLVLLAAVLVVAVDGGFRPRHFLTDLALLRSGADDASAGYGLLAAVLAHRRLLTTGLALLSLGFMALSAYWFSPGMPQSNRAGAVAAMLAGGVALGMTLLVAQRRDSIRLPVVMPLSPARSNGLVVLLGLLLLAAVTAITVRIGSADLLAHVPTHLQFALWLGGIMLVGWGLCGAPRPRWPRVRWAEVLVVVILAAAAFAVRIYHLETAIHTSVDEVHFMDGVRFLRENASFRLLTSGSLYLPVTMLPLYLNYVTIELVGQSSLASLRLTQAIMGTISVLAVYGLCRALFDRPVALAAALVTLGFPPHVHFSRIAMAHISDTVFGTLTLMFIARGLRDNRRSDWAAGGICLGLTQYFFEGGRLLFPPIVVVWIGLVLLTQRQRLRETGRGVLVYVVAALFTAAPVYYAVYALDAPRTSRFADSGVSSEYVTSILREGLNERNVSELLTRATDPYLMYVSRAEGILQYYGGSQPLIMTIFVPFFLIGVAYLLWRWRSLSIVLVIWVTGAAFGNSLLHDPFQSPRYVDVMPALAACIAVGIGCVAPLLLGGIRSRQRLASALVVGAAAITCVVMVGYYFGPHLRLFNVQMRETKGYADPVDAVLRVVNRYPRGTTIVIISEPEADGNVPQQLLNYLSSGAYRLQVAASSTVTADFFAQLPRNVPYAFFIDPADVRALNLIQRHFIVQPPQYSTSVDLPASREFILLYAPVRMT